MNYICRVRIYDITDFKQISIRIGIDGAREYVHCLFFISKYVHCVCAVICFIGSENKLNHKLKQLYNVIFHMQVSL